MKANRRAVSELRKLQQIVRSSHPKNERTIATRRIPKDLSSKGFKSMAFYQVEFDAVQRTAGALETDLGFEHLEHPEEQVWRFAIAASFERSTDQVADFVRTHDQPAFKHYCFIPILHLSTKVERRFGGISIIPLDDARIPKPIVDMRADPQARSVAMIPVEGTNLGAMAMRARSFGDHELRKLRAVVQGATFALHKGQIRFQLGRAYAFTDQLHGWKNGTNASFDLELTDETMQRAHMIPVSEMEEHPTSDVARKADVSLRWIERAQLATSAVVSLLFLFFALEALLGDTSEGLKAHGLAFRRAMLSHLSGHQFAHPDGTYYLYDEVRSKPSTAKRLSTSPTPKSVHFPTTFASPSRSIC